MDENRDGRDGRDDEREKEEEYWREDEVIISSLI
jgi:hypothetical protein